MVLDTDQRFGVAQSLGRSGLYVFAFFGWLGPAGANIGISLMALGFVLDRRVWQRSMAFEPLNLVVMISAAYILTLTVWAIRVLPDTYAEQLDSLGDWLFLLLFILPAWWLLGDIQRLLRVWLLALAGFVLGLLLSLDAEHITLLLTGERSGFHIGKPIAFGLYSGAVIITLLVLAPRLWQVSDRSQSHRLWFVIWLAALLVLLQALIYTHSRGSWLAAAVAVPVALGLRYRGGLWPRAPRLSFGAGIVVVALVGTTVWLNLTTVSARIKDETSTIVAIVSGQIAEAPASSISYRVWLWQIGVDQWLQRPLFGWGPGSTEYLVARSNHPEVNAEEAGILDHLHNTYLEILLRFGVLGAALVLIVISLLLRATLSAWRHGQLPWDIAVVIIASFILTAVWGCFDFRSLHHDWRFFWLLLAGSACMFVWPGLVGQRLLPRSNLTPTVPP